ncbi:Pyruvate/2-oxoglutarate dehydrogenase complex, dihydrolipoamide dehydrogenase (E3) component [Bryocella elongata]|uniref:Pyruvate/2-oxoglutarate dehydrogenase complex, dihydrolipoamide dehydrogenase (E3) component n=1 Tax=Bryocella elongata TaxID=863522 RepID=A0A1H5ZL37_9BACT|nr:FAD-containing oxidoreductase [Bryocella elongata]SEG36941.1 Pyruvate/2-oxoglutarate dehydrogenase complex, dihydrolipoamide dehydrogenase (E3) component [Bryocella elongata]
MTQRFDDIVVGSGQAGPFLAVRLANAGRRVAIVERKFFGGTCVNVGCTPTKTMIASAETAHRVRESVRWGVHHAGEVTVSMPEVQLRTQKVVMSSRNGIEKMLRSTPNITVFKGTAHFTSPTTLNVKGEDTAEIEGERIFLNVGTRAAVPDLKGVHDVPFLTNTTLLAMQEVPDHLVVVGGGYIGLEFAQMFRRFGSKVTVVEMGPRLAAHEDPDVTDALIELFTQEDIGLRLNAECIAMAPGAKGGVQVHVNCNEGEPAVQGSHVLLAVGRTPNTQDLGLEAAGVIVDDRGYTPVNDELQTNVPHIYALGDCNKRGAFTHTSYNDFEIVADNLIDGAKRRVTDRIQAHALYTDPPVAQVGMTEVEVKKSGRNALVGRRAMTRVGRAVEKGESFGFMKILADADSKEILGATIFGVGGDEAIHAIVDLMYAKAPYTTLQHAVHIHPTVAELLPTVAGDLKPLT